MEKGAYFCTPQRKKRISYKALTDKDIQEKEATLLAFSCLKKDKILLQAQDKKKVHKNLKKDFVEWKKPPTFAPR